MLNRSVLALERLATAEPNLPLEILAGVSTAGNAVSISMNWKEVNVVFGYDRRSSGRDLIKNSKDIFVTDPTGTSL
jgi:hypothetical protein